MAEIREQKDAVIFLVDMHPSMLQPNQHNGDTKECNAAQVLRAALSFIKTKIITAESDRLAIILYGQNADDISKRVEVLYALDQPDATLIKDLESRILALGYSEEPSSLIGADLKTDQRVPLNEALWACQQELRAIEKESFAKRLFIFTDCDSPVDEDDRELSETRASDLAALEVNIELFPLPASDQLEPSFAIRKFFANLITFDEDDIADGVLDVEAATLKLNELSERIR